MADSWSFGIKAIAENNYYNNINKYKTTNNLNFNYNLNSTSILIQILRFYKRKTQKNQKKSMYQYKNQEEICKKVMN